MNLDLRVVTQRRVITSQMVPAWLRLSNADRQHLPHVYPQHPTWDLHQHRNSILIPTSAPYGYIMSPKESHGSNTDFLTPRVKIILPNSVCVYVPVTYDG